MFARLKIKFKKNSTHLSAIFFFAEIKAYLISVINFSVGRRTFFNMLSQSPSG